MLYKLGRYINAAHAAYVTQMWHEPQGCVLCHAVIAVVITSIALPASFC